jgi:hypothetical protein
MPEIIVFDTAQHVASLSMIFPQNTFLQLNSHYTKQLVVYLAGIAVIALLLLSFIVFKTKLFAQDKINNKKILITLIAVIGAAQLVYSGINYSLFKDAYLDMAYTSKDFVQNIIGENIASVYAKGLTLQNIKGLDEYLDSD